MLVREFFLGFIKIHILHHASQEAVYGLGMIEELARHGYPLSPGTIYPILRSLEEEGCLELEEALYEGRVRKYYRTTAKGEAALAEAKAKIRELVAELL
jgi:DNA-binding PadR family transcriptional regulator